MMKSIFHGGVALGALLAASAPAWAQTADAAPDPALAATSADDAGVDIIVTANRREERLQDVPVSVSAFGGEQLQDMRISDVRDLNNVAPGLRISAADAAANPKIFIRGAGLSDFNPSSSSGVGIYVDGVYVGSPLAQLAGFYDIERIEVLRGPQGTLFGRNTTGGAINVITKRPQQAFGGEASAEYGERNSLTLNAAVTGPIATDRLAFRVSGQYVRDDGTTKNRVTGNRIGYQDRYAARGQLLFTPDDDVEFLAQGSFFRNRGSAVPVKHRGLFAQPGTPTGPDGLCAGDFRDGGCRDALGYYDSSDDPFSVESNLEGKDEVDVKTLSLSATIGLPGFDVISVTAYQDAWRDARENTDGSPLQMLESRYNSSQSQFSQEIRFQSQGHGRARWVAGAYYMRDHLRDNSSYDVLRDLRPLFTTPENPTGVSVEDSVALFSWPYTQKTDSYAFFGQLDYDVTERITVTGGLRWSADDKAINYTSQAEGGAIVLLRKQDRKTFSDWSGRAILAYKFSPDVNGYLSYNRGYKSGGFFGGQATLPEQLEPYDNETLNAYEAGLKTQFMDGRMRANASAFYYDYANQQVYSLEVRNGISMQVLTNAASSRAWGGELEVAGSPLRGLSVNFSASYLNTRILDFVSAGEDYSGNKLQHSPEWTLSGFVSYDAELANGSAITFSGSANWRSRVFFDNTERQRVSTGPLTLVDAQVGWRSPGGGFEAGVFAKNLFDKRYLGGISALESLGYDALSFGAPRRAGVYANVKF
ncbi:TonB-dependent receptor [Sandaracinobacter sp. RS1-74]|uniref:TonB-dependent receptor n=1 Tax=Sandaracinobacteroides sayramensis TaxID=2913411 RepID=UPI001EDC8AA3|nr:TonB-dependent receptor [Sandaracinobacteroides sayramensis]MCG2841381.1 TonB-dependent receptor [Sandaracinobacteroides sayramensis]